MSPGFGLAASLAALAVASATPALAAPAKFSIETSYRLGYDTNPFLSAGSDLSATYIETSIAPKLVKQSEKGSISASGHFDRTGYFERYGKTDQYGAEMEAQQRVTPKLSVFAALRYDSSVIGQGEDAVTGDPVDAPDVNLIGLRRRADTYSASGGWQYQLTSKDKISADGGFTATRYRNGPSGNDSDNYGGRIGYSRAISPRTNIGVSASVYRIEYDRPGLATLIMQPSVTFSTILAQNWTFDASLGISFSDLSLPPSLGKDSNSKGMSGSLKLCHNGQRDYFCFFGDRSVSASGVGGTVERTQLGFNYRHSFNERLAFSADGSYARSKSQAALIGTREFVTYRGGLSWLVTRGIKVGADGRYRDVFGSGQIRSDIGGEIYATVNLLGR